ncbi:hypothetical protein GCM10025857_32260 [Alicyclobacillus contaminans]|nr:hypothetical protein GCM10025857_32260 [Alicyclobacillus contaminans]
MPNDQVIVRYLQMPVVPETALRQAIEVELGVTIHLPFEDPVFDVKRVPGIGAMEAEADQMGVCLIAAPKAVIAERIGLVRAVGLNPVAVDIQPLALIRVGNIKPRDPSELMILVQLDDEELALSIFVGSHLYFVRTMEMGIGREVDDPMLLKSAAEDIVYEMNRVVNFFNFNLGEVERPVGVVYVHTLHPKKHFIIEQLNQQLSTEVNLIELGVVGQMNDVSPEAFMALGLSMRRGYEG